MILQYCAGHALGAQEILAELKLISGAVYLMRGEGRENWNAGTKPERCGTLGILSRVDEPGAWG